MQYSNPILLTFNAPWVPTPATRPPPSTNPVLAVGRQEGGVACVPKHALIALLCISLTVLWTIAKTIIWVFISFKWSQAALILCVKHNRWLALSRVGWPRWHVPLCPWCYLTDCAKIPFPTDIRLPRLVPAAHLQLRSAWQGTAQLNCFWMFPLK